MTTQTYAVNDDGITIYDIATGNAVCVCGPDFLDQDYSKFRVWPDEQVQRTYAVLIAKLLNEGAK